MDIQQYDSFFLTLEQKIKCDPTQCRCIIKDAVSKSQCPYLQSRLRELEKMYQKRLSNNQ